MPSCSAWCCARQRPGSGFGRSSPSVPNRAGSSPLGACGFPRASVHCAVCSEPSMPLCGRECLADATALATRSLRLKLPGFTWHVLLTSQLSRAATFAGFSARVRGGNSPQLRSPARGENPSRTDACAQGIPWLGRVIDGTYAPTETLSPKPQVFGASSRVGYDKVLRIGEGKILRQLAAIAKSVNAS